MNNPEAIRYVNEVIRPLAEQMRGLIILANAAKTAWDGGIGANFSDDNAAVEDGRDAEGVSRLTCLHVNQLIGELFKLATGGSANLNSEIIARPCVRSLP